MIPTWGFRHWREAQVASGAQRNPRPGRQLAHGRLQPCGMPQDAPRGAVRACVATCLPQGCSPSAAPGHPACEALCAALCCTRARHGLRCALPGPRCGPRSGWQCQDHRLGMPALPVWLGMPALPVCLPQHATPAAACAAGALRRRRSGHHGLQRLPDDDVPLCYARSRRRLCSCSQHL